MEKKKKKHVRYRIWGFDMAKSIIWRSGFFNFFFSITGTPLFYVEEEEEGGFKGCGLSYNEISYIKDFFPPPPRYIYRDRSL